ncbi:MAG: CRISPR-associated protein Cas4 [Candidatus Woesearchaeota archaeon]
MINVTDLTSYMFCPRKLYLTKVKGIKEPPSSIMIQGSIKHKVLEEVHKSEERIVRKLKYIPSKEELDNLFSITHSTIIHSVIMDEMDQLEFFQISPSDLFSQIHSIVRDETVLQSSNAYNLIREHNLIGDDLFEIKEPKIKTELIVDSDRLGLKGKIDKLEIFKDFFVPVEIKTGKIPRSPWKDHIIQVCAYAMMLEDKYDTKIDQGHIIYYKPRTLHKVSFNQFMKDEVIDLINKVNILLNSTDLPDFCNNPNICNFCGLRQKCYDFTDLPL